MVTFNSNYSLFSWTFLWRILKQSWTNNYVPSYFIPILFIIYRKQNIESVFIDYVEIAADNPQ
jgi:hypothetical protein